VAENELLMRCSCHSAEHIAWLIHELDDDRGNNLKVASFTGAWIETQMDKST
jgi:hypothetical protein